MRVPKRLGEARKIIKENTPDVEKLIQEKIAEFRNLDITGILKEQDGFDELTNGMNEQEKAVFDSEFESMVDKKNGLINTLADYLEDPETREKIIEELKARVRGS